VDRTGVGDVGSLGGTGGAEIAIVADIWRAATGRGELTTVVANHGFHGPREGELSSRVWREDDSQLKRLLEDYALRPDPAERDRESRARAPGLRRELLAALPAHQRPAAALVLELAARRLPLRGVGKRSFLQALDVARGAARVVGRHLHDAGLLDAPDDVFQLTYSEVTATFPTDLRELVKLRSERAKVYRDLEIPASWRGAPAATRRSDLGAADRPLEVKGIGVSDGVIEASVRVVTDIAVDDIEPGEVLVAPTTDPSWASIMYVSSALVVDLGGPLSHAAVVARELGIPCVVNTRTGSRDLRTGDRVRVDGRAGTVHVIARGIS
jgi:pyruvate,water dikinase